MDYNKIEFHTVDGRRLHMTVNRISAGAIEIVLANVSYEESRNRHVQRLICALFAYTACIRAISTHMGLHSAFWLLISFQLYHLFKLVQQEKLLFLKEFCLQSTGTHFLGRKNHLFLSTGNVHDVVINEVIYGMKVIYVLVVLAKGTEFQKKPIIPLFTSLNPSVECLKIIYNQLQNMLEDS